MFYLHPHQFSLVCNIQSRAHLCECLYRFLSVKSDFNVRFKRKMIQNKEKKMTKRNIHGDTRNRFAVFLFCFLLFPKRREPNDLLGICIIEINNRTEYPERSAKEHRLMLAKKTDAQNNWYSIFLFGVAFICSVSCSAFMWNSCESQNGKQSSLQNSN